MSTTTNVTNLIINKLTKAQYEAIQNPDPTQLYFIIDDNEYAEVSDLPQPSNTAPGMDGTAAAGIAATYSRSDHIHPIDTSRAPLDSPAFTGQPTTPTPLGTTTEISGLQNLTLSNLTWQTYSPPKGEDGIRSTISPSPCELTTNDKYVNITLDQTTYSLPFKGNYTITQSNSTITGYFWGGLKLDEFEGHPVPILDCSKYPLGIAYTETTDSNETITTQFYIIFPSDTTFGTDYTTLSINSSTTKPDNQKIVNVGYLDSILSEYSSVEPEDDFNIVAMLIETGVTNVLTDEDDAILIDNNNTIISGDLGDSQTFGR